MSQNQKNLLWAFLCPILFIIVLWNLIPFVYGIVDDRTMMEVVSGQYLGTPDPHTIFIGYWYSSLLAGLYRLAPGVDWYALGCLTLQGGCMALILYRLLGQQETKKGRILSGMLALLWCTALGIRTTAQFTFTTVAAVLAVTVIFWYMTTKKFRIPELVILFILCFLAAEMRFLVYCMVVPVCAVLWLFRVWEDRADGIKNPRHMAVPFIAGGAALLYLAGFFLGYGSEGWKTYTDYNDTCTVIFDYDDYMFPRYEDDTELYNQVGIFSKPRAKNLYYYNYTADDQIDTEFFHQYLSVRKEQVKDRRNPAARLAGSIKSYIKNVLKGTYGYGHLLALIGYGALILWYLTQKEWRLFLKVCAVLGTQFVLWTYLIYRGRMPLRVLVCMNLMLAVPLLLMWREELSYVKISGRLKKAALALMPVLLAAAAVFGIFTVRLENKEKQKMNDDVEQLKEYCMEHPENFYFNDVTSMAMSSYNVHLWQEEPYVMNYISLGDWISFSPVWAQKLEQHGIKDVPKALYGQDNIYLICNFDRGLEYLTTIYEGASFTEVDKIHGFKIYKLDRP